MLIARSATCLQLILLIKYNRSETKFDTDNIPIDIIDCLISIGYLRCNPIEARFIIVSPKFLQNLQPNLCIKIFCLCFRPFRQIQAYDNKCRFFIGVNTFQSMQNNKPVTDALKNLINVGIPILFQSLIFLPYIINCHMLGF